LRHPKVHSTIDDLATGSFIEIIDDANAKPALVKKIVFTSGRLYYDLEKYREENNLTDVAIVRMEQIYPIAIKQINKIAECFT